MKKPKWVLIFSVLSATTFFILGVIFSTFIWFVSDSFFSITDLLIIYIVLLIISIFVGIIEYNSIENEIKELEKRGKLK